MITIANANAKHIPLADQSVQCIVTSPPYWGLRSYLEDCDELKNSEIGLERTPAAYVASIVAVMRECWRVLKDTGVLFLNLGDSYAGSGKGPTGYNGIGNQANRQGFDSPGAIIPDGLKTKDLCGIPWMVAKALQQPFYTGRIAEEKDRVWLAAMIDAEGTICGFTHQRKDDGRIRTGVHVAITNSNMKLLNEANRIWPASFSEHDKPGEGHLGKMDTYRWIAHNVNEKSLLMRELYPYLIAKKKQALLAYNLFEISKNAKKLGKSGEAQATHDKRAVIVDLISKLNHMEDVDIPDWCIEPPSLYEPGFYLRQDIIWSKPNPMPESVTDRCTKAHEYVFLLTKSARYYYDAEAIKEPGSIETVKRMDRGVSDQHKNINGAPGQPPHSMSQPRQNTRNGKRDYEPTTRNRRSVWTVATSPYSGSHFATFPPKLIEPMILAGTSQRGECPHCGKAWVRVTETTRENYISRQDRQEATGGAISGGVGKNFPDTKSYTIGWRQQCDCPPHEPIPQIVLDPFSGSGTTGKVAIAHGRRAVMLDLNTKYIDLQFERTSSVQVTLPL